MPKTYGYLQTDVPGMNLPRSIMDEIRNQTWPGGAPIDEAQYWQDLTPYLTALYPGVIPEQPKQAFQPPPLPAGAVSVSPEQLAQMRSAQAGGGIYSVLNPNLNIAPSTAAANLTAYTQEYTSPTATTGLDFLKSLPGTMTLPPTTSPTPNLPATPYGRPRPTTTAPTSLRTSFRPQRSKGGFGYIPRSTYGRI